MSSTQVQILALRNAVAMLASSLPIDTLQVATALIHKQVQEQRAELNLKVELTEDDKLTEDYLNELSGISKMFSDLVQIKVNGTID
jgi:hypothetical protein